MPSSSRVWPTQFSGGDAPVIICPEPSLTDQSQKDDSDLNVLLERFRVTGQLPAPVRMPEYGDFSGPRDLMTAVAILDDAKAQFMTLPAGFRASLGNDPARYLEYLADPKNQDDLVKRGWLIPREKPVENPSSGTPQSTGSAHSPSPSSVKAS